ncbi:MULTISPECIES: carboxymuconolactone decarboxylase family protein [unclassified Arthrobacter]|uniref:carboxymuconolactone decarboxylase family protein n=1 Tax=unclassified Arthrobacter TaxID=235627 RepID=UPI0028835334|nr:MULTISPECIES: carboxymuconolactone decarboxylase family protein [unclassified Arthrobacter]
MTPTSAEEDMSSLSHAFSSASVAEQIKGISPEVYDAAARFWRVPVEAGALTPRMQELILLAMHASASALNAEAIGRQVKRARLAGATEEDVLDTLIIIVGLANHALYKSVPVLEEELTRAGVSIQIPDAHPEFEEVKGRFIAARGFWNSDRDRLATFLPEYVLALTDLSVASSGSGQLSNKERELICIATDCTVNHAFEAGLRLHIRNAISLGASGAEILHVFQLAALLGLEGYILGANALFGASGQLQAPAY